VAPPAPAVAEARGKVTLATIPRGLRSSSVSVPAYDSITARTIDNPSPNPLLLFMPRAASPRTKGSNKRLEHVFLDGVGDAGPIVFDRDSHRRRREIDALSTMADCIVDQIGQRAVELVGIGQYHHVIRSIIAHMMPDVEQFDQRREPLGRMLMVVMVEEEPGGQHQMEHDQRNRDQHRDLTANTVRQLGPQPIHAATTGGANK
jgi:hypothetical protein